MLYREDVIKEVILVQVNHGKSLKEDWDSGKSIKKPDESLEEAWAHGRVERSFLIARYFMLDRGVDRREFKRPVTNTGYFEELVASDGLSSSCKYIEGKPCIRNYVVMKILEKVFTLGLKRSSGVGDFKEESLNLYIGQLMNVALSNGVRADRVRKVLSNVYKFGFWCGKG